MEYKKTILNSILAGFSIGLGGLIFLSVDNAIVGSVLFSVGLFLVLTMSFSLFTGKVCYILEGSIPKNLINIVIIWCGNFMGSFILSSIIRYTRRAEVVIEKASSLCQVKYQDSYFSLFLLGIICNIFIFIGVEEYNKNKHEIGKYLGIILSVMGFILVGSEHCVADMFYFNVVAVYSTDMFGRLLIITLGNAVGGIIANFAVNHRK